MKSGAPSKLKGGKLSREDVRLWVEVAKTVTPQPGSSLPETDDGQLDAVSPPLIPAPSPPKATTSKIRTATPEKPKSLPLAPIERRLRQRLSRGQLDVSMKLDLHGLRQEEAHLVLHDFLARAIHNDARIVLIVTGKGNATNRDDAGFASQPGILRRVVPQWLTEPSMRHIVLGFEEASPTHGGSGALYVRLRSARRSGAKEP